jgi:C1A family cysteine protease
MKTLLIILLIASACAQLNPTFEQWQVEHGKKFNFFERIFFRKVFNTNKADVDAHNENSENSYKKSLNEFSHITTEEFISTRCRTIVPPESRSRAATPKDEANIAVRQAPDSVDYSKLMRGVQNQGSCGACYAFSTMAQIEGRLKRANSSYTAILSPQYIIDCDINQSGCTSGWPTYAMSEYIT